MLLTTFLVTPLVNPIIVIKDPFTYTFKPVIRAADSSLMAGHIKLVKSLLSCEGVSKVKFFFVLKNFWTWSVIKHHVFANVSVLLILG